MMFDVVLPSVLFLCASAALALFLKCEKRIRSALEGEFRCRDAVLIVIAIGFAVTITALIPEQAVMFGFLFYLAVALFGLANVFARKWYLSILLPAVFAALYFFFWNTLLLNLFSMTTVVFSTALLSASFSWIPHVKTRNLSIFSRKNIFSGLVLFVVLIVLADVILVFGTNLMATAARKIVVLQLPLLVIVPTFPSTGSYVSLGLGDIFLSGLLGILTAKKMGRKPGILCLLSISATVLLGETIMLNFNAGPLPATILVVSGWLAALGIKHLRALGGLW